MEQPLVQLRGVVAGYGKHTVLRGIDLEFRPGEFCAIIGPNGCGKSTLLKAMIGFLPVFEGEIFVFGKALPRWKAPALARKISLIPQEISYQFDIPVRDIVLSGRHPYLRFGQDYSPGHHAFAEQVLRDFDLWDLRDIPISCLSGGEKQRVHLARAWAQDTPVLMMDESFANLDLSHQVEAMNRLAARHREGGRLVIVVSHNINLAAEYCNRIVLMNRGVVVCDGSPEDVLRESVLRDVYQTDVIRIDHPVSGRPNLLYPPARP
jgi:iron complex transport system ATP-binding protein